MRRLSELGGKRLPFLRWSVLRMVFGARHLLTSWQVGDGREEALARHLAAQARAGDLDDVIRVIDEFCYEQSIMMNVGDEKGEILDRAVQRTRPRRLLELGTYCGYSALRMARVMPADARLSRSSSARRTPRSPAASGTMPASATAPPSSSARWATAEATIARLEAEHGFARGSVDFVFVDHDKAAYLPDLERILDARLAAPRLGRGRRQREVPGRTEYRAYMRSAGRADLAHGRARDPRRVPVAAQGPRARVGVPRELSGSGSSKSCLETPPAVAAWPSGGVAGKAQVPRPTGR